MIVDVWDVMDPAWKAESEEEEFSVEEAQGELQGLREEDEGKEGEGAGEE